MQTVKTRVRKGGITILTCPVCGTFKRASVANFKYKKHVLKVRCSCKAVYKVLLDYRNHNRKSVNLSGTYTTHYQYHQSKGLMEITNISRRGLQFHVVGLNRLHPGSILKLEIQLDNNNQLISIRKLALACYIDNTIVGCEFVELVDREDLDRDLAFYMRF